MVEINAQKFAWLVLEKSNETDPEKLLSIYQSALNAANAFNKPAVDKQKSDTAALIKAFGGK